MKKAVTPLHKFLVAWRPKLTRNETGKILSYPPFQATIGSNNSTGKQNNKRSKAPVSEIRNFASYVGQPPWIMADLFPFRFCLYFRRSRLLKWSLQKTQAPSLDHLELSRSVDEKFDNMQSASVRAVVLRALHICPWTVTFRPTLVNGSRMYHGVVPKQGI